MGAFYNGNGDAVADFVWYGYYISKSKLGAWQYLDD
jgi:hypothetical protein